MYKTRLRQFPIFGPEGNYIDRATGGELVTAVEASPAVVYEGAAAAALPVSYTGDKAVDANSEGSTPVESGNKMLVWLVVGGIALFALFGKNMLKAR